MPEPLDQPEPTVFQWWAEIWLPAGLGILTLVLTMLSVWLAVRAIGIANRANQLTEAHHAEQRRAEREGVAVELNDVMTTLVLGWLPKKPNAQVFSDAVQSVLDTVNRYRVRQNPSAQRLADQLYAWHLSVGILQSAWPDQDERVNFLLAVSEEWKQAIARYVADDSGTFLMTKSEHQLKDFIG